jgi:hypothetical protein
MGSIQIHNAEHDVLQTADRQAYEHYHEPTIDTKASKDGSCNQSVQMRLLIACLAAWLETGVFVAEMPGLR